MAELNKVVPIVRSRILSFLAVVTVPMAIFLKNSNISSADYTYPQLSSHGARVVDLASTICVLLGLPPPAHSQGLVKYNGGFKVCRRVYARCSRYLIGARTTSRLTKSLEAKAKVC